MLKSFKSFMRFKGNLNVFFSKSVQKYRYIVI